jgi:O-acetyl-ADP-ribose deacetylase (regulator of RNase III)
MRFVKGNILDAESGIIGHQVNCQLRMGAGLGGQIRAKYPTVYQEYLKMSPFLPDNLLGKCQIVTVKPGELFVANLFGQWHYYPRNRVHTDYGALCAAMKALFFWWKNNCHENFPIFLPSGIGCGLAGGDWNVVKSMIEEQIPNAIIVRLVDAKKG